ncbi:MAG: MBL fold metallo-hydrolase [Candidatus Krumholzibacteriota bacterium]|nr:MBL fold metallo-hydrolase [Candidatus Krumholzibacteriota bacterium]
MKLLEMVFLVYLALPVAALYAAGEGADPDGVPPLPAGKGEVHEIKLDKLSITVLYNNITDREGFESAWGFACLIEGTGKTILFDTGGDGKVLLRNMGKLAVAPSSVEYVMISHEHWDHVNGLAAFLEKNSRVKVFSPASFSKAYKEQVDGSGAERVEVKGPLEICPGVYSTGEMGSRIVEQSLVIRTDAGPLVITGCAHPGIVDIVRQAVSLVGGKPLLVMGGFHLGGKSEEDLEKIVADFRELGVVYAGPSHCTGEKAIEYFREKFQDHFLDSGGGEVINAARLGR